MNKIKILFLFFISIILFGCGSIYGNENANTNRAYTREIERILGSDKGWYKYEMIVLKDFTVSGLRIRVSQSSSPNTNCLSNQPVSIEIDGAINKDTSFIIEKLLGEYPNCVRPNGNSVAHNIYMNSNGGSLEDGYAMGRVIRRHQAAARVVSHQVCASACAVAFLGGHFRSLEGDGVLIFHAPYIKTENYLGDSIRCANKDQSQSLLSYYWQMLLDKDVAAKVYERTMDYCSRSDGWTLDVGAAKFFGITNSN